MLSIFCVSAQDMYNVQIVHVVFHSHMMKTENTITLCDCIYISQYFPLMLEFAWRYLPVNTSISQGGKYRPTLMSGDSTLKVLLTRIA